MSEMLTTKDGQEIGAWLLKANQAVYDAHGALDRFGAIESWSVHPTYRADLMDVGQRVFLYVGQDSGRSEPPGIWGVGVVTGPTRPGRPSRDGLWREERPNVRDRFAAVEIHRLETPIPRADLLADPVLAGCELIKSPQMSNPTVLRPDEVAALDSFDLTTVPPTPEQLAMSDEPNSDTHDDEPWSETLATLVDGKTRYGLIDEGPDPDGPLKIFRSDNFTGEDTDDWVLVSQFEDSVDALDAWLDLAGDIGSRAPIHADPPEGVEVEVEAVAVVALGDGDGISIIRLDTDLFGVMYPGDTAFDAGYPDLPSALADLFTDDDEDEDTESD